MTTPLPQLLANVTSLNDPAEPFAFEATGRTAITGRWDIVHAQFVGLQSAGTIDEDYQIVVTLDEGKHTYDFTEKKRKTESAVGDAGDGKVGMSFGTSTFSGKSSSKQFSFTAGDVNRTKDGLSPVLMYSFETSRIKEPLFTYLESNGWTRKKGFLSGLFNR
jgi:hypothetical protein